ncbi:ribonuclease H-like domain-containing protein [Tanacetum coccineum]
MSANDNFSLHDDEELSLHDDASLDGSVPASNKGDAPAKPPQIITTNTLSNIKLPVLQKDDYDTWAMEMEHYLEYIDNEVWKVIQNGNSKKRVTKGKDGVYRVLPPTTQEEQFADEKERKARTLLLMVVPKDHLRRFHGMDDAKEIWAAIKTRFGGNANSKKMQKAVLKQQFEAFTISSKESLEKGYDRFQKLLSQLDALGAGVSDEDANHKFLRSLPPAWDSLAMTMRTKKNIDTLSIDDLYNNLSVFEQDIQKTSSSSLTSDNVAFLSQAKASSSKHKPSHSSGSYSSYTTSSSKATTTATPGLADEVIHSFLATNADDVDLIHEDLDQIDDLDLEEMDINWQIAMTAIKIKKFYKKTGRTKRDNFSEKDTVRATYRHNSTEANLQATICASEDFYIVGLEPLAVIWNPSVRKCVGIPILNVLHLQVGYTRIGFGVCPHTNDPKLVKINVVETPGVCWEVQVFTLSSRVWKTAFTGAPLRSCRLMFEHVLIDGIIYWSTRGSFILSFDLKSDTFGEVSIPERFVRIYGIWVAKVNGSLGLLEYNKEGEMWVCGVWMRKDDVNNPFTKIYTVKVEGKSVFFRVLGFRNNDEVLLQLDDDDFEKSQIEVYEPSPGRINSVGISGELFPALECLDTDFTWCHAAAAAQKQSQDGMNYGGYHYLLFELDYGMTDLDVLPSPCYSLCTYFVFTSQKRILRSTELPLLSFNQARGGSKAWLRVARATHEVGSHGCISMELQVHVDRLAEFMGVPISVAEEYNSVVKSEKIVKFCSIELLKSPSKLPEKNSSSNTSAKLARAKLDKYSGDVGMSKDMLGPEQPGELRRSWYVEGHLGYEGVSSGEAKLTQILINAEELDHQAKAKATPRKLVYVDSKKEALDRSMTKGFSDRFSLESIGTSDTRGETHSAAERARRKKSKLKERRLEYQETSTDSEYDEGSEDTCEDLNSPYKRPKPTPFTPRITHFKYHRRAKLPKNIRVYEGNKDPEDHLSIFSAATEQKEWPIPIWCKMFRQTLGGAAKNWFDDLDPKSVDSFEELSEKFLEEFSQEKRYAKDPTEIHGIKRR